MKNPIITVLGASMCLSIITDGAAQQPARTDKAQSQDAIWDGVFVAEKTYGPALKGPVSLHDTGANWIARIQGETVSAIRESASDGSVTWSFSFKDQGRFEGWQERAGGEIVGHWIQPPGVIQNYSFASPVYLTSAGERAFAGMVTPFPQEVSLNIPLIAEDDGTYRTFLRNPQRNFGVYFRIETASIDGDEIHFTNRDDDVLAVGKSTDPGERFTMLFPRFGETFDFTRRNRGDASGFYPRRLRDGATVLPRPTTTGDGWRTAAPEEAGLDRALISELVTSIALFEPTALREPYIHGLLIAHRGKLVVDEYFHGYDRDTPHDSRSAGKSLTSALLGIAIRKGAIENVDAPAYGFFGGVNAYDNPDPRKERMTLRHLVTMSPGLACDDGNSDSPGNEDVMQSQNDESDWYRYTLNLPMENEPGAADFYCTAGMNLIGGAIAQATGTTLRRFFHEEFAKPLGIQHYFMNLSPDERGYMGGGIRLRPRDFLKLGQLYLDEGVWKGDRIISKDWVAMSAAAHSSLNSDDDYGFGWWRQAYDVNGQSIDTYYASGNGGQLLFVVPELELVALIQAGNYSDGRTRNEFRDRFMQDYILPAAIKND